MIKKRDLQHRIAMLEEAIFGKGGKDGVIVETLTTHENGWLLKRMNELEPLRREFDVLLKHFKLEYVKTTEETKWNGKRDKYFYREFKKRK